MCVCINKNYRDTLLASDVPRFQVYVLGVLVQRQKAKQYIPYMVLRCSLTWSFEAEYEPVTNVGKTVNSRNLDSIIKPTRGDLSLYFAVNFLRSS